MLKRTLSVLLCLCALFSVSVSAQDTADPFENTYHFLDNNPPASMSIPVYSLDGRQPKKEARNELYNMLDRGLNSGFSNPADLGKGIVCLLKLEQDPTSYQKNNLISILYTYEKLYDEGLDGAVWGLIAYNAIDLEVPSNARNSVSSLIDVLVSAQGKDGGYAVRLDKDPDPYFTSKVLMALAPMKENQYVSDAIEKALDWLGNQQNDDGSFSTSGSPTSQVTASVLTSITMCGVSLDDSRFVKNGFTLTDALAQFKNSDGGYSYKLDGESDVAATEQALLALHTLDSGLSPMLAPAVYPGYVKPQQDPIVTFIKFLGGFVLIFGLIYLALIFTGKIGKKFSPPQDPPSSGEEDTMEINIPMKAQVPDFDGLEKEVKTPAD